MWRGHRRVTQTHLFWGNRTTAITKNRRCTKMHSATGWAHTHFHRPQGTGRWSGLKWWKAWPISPVTAGRTDKAALTASIWAPEQNKNAISCNTHSNFLLQLQKRLPARHVWNKYTPLCEYKMYTPLLVYIIFLNAPISYLTHYSQQTEGCLLVGGCSILTHLLYIHLKSPKTQKYCLL